MAAPIAKGLIITASVLVAAGIAISQNDHIREWILSYRRKLAMALHSLGDEISPTAQSHGNRGDDDSEAALEMRRRRREEIVRLNRLEMIRQARQEGISVDLDQLVKLGEAEEERAMHSVSTTANTPRTFDALVGADGKLRLSEMSQATGADLVSSGLRQRGAGARGLDAGFTLANPFDDEAQVLFDRELIGHAVGEDKTQQSRESTRTLSPQPRSLASTTESPYFSEEEMDAQIDEAIRRSLHDQTVDENPAVQDHDLMDMDPPESVPVSTENSYYYAPPPNVHQPPVNAQSMYASAMEAMLEADTHNETLHDADDEANVSSGTLTPTEDGLSSAPSLVGSQAGDVGRMSDFHSVADENHSDARSEATDDTFSVVGASTPGSWTDVESEAGDEESHAAHPPVVTNTL